MQDILENIIEALYSDRFLRANYDFNKLDFGCLSDNTELKLSLFTKNMDRTLKLLSQYNSNIERCASNIKENIDKIRISDCEIQTALKKANLNWQTYSSNSDRNWMVIQGPGGDLTAYPPNVSENTLFTTDRRADDATT